MALRVSSALESHSCLRDALASWRASEPWLYASVIGGYQRYGKALKTPLNEYSLLHRASQKVYGFLGYLMPVEPSRLYGR
jgi:hypothetical protein